MINAYFSLSTTAHYVALGLIIGYWLSAGISYWLNQNQDWNDNFFNSNGYKLSMRETIVAKSFDLTFWFIIELIQNWRHPNHLQLSNMTLEWV